MTCIQLQMRWNVCGCALVRHMSMFMCYRQLRPCPSACQRSCNTALPSTSRFFWSVVSNDGWLVLPIDIVKACSAFKLTGVITGPNIMLAPAPPKQVLHNNLMHLYGSAGPSSSSTCNMSSCTRLLLANSQQHGSIMTSHGTYSLPNRPKGPGMNDLVLQPQHALTVFLTTLCRPNQMASVHPLAACPGSAALKVVPW